jgi:hypothetical protein
VGYAKDRARREASAAPDAAPTVDTIRLTVSSSNIRLRKGADFRTFSRHKHQTTSWPPMNLAQSIFAHPYNTLVIPFHDRDPQTRATAATWCLQRPWTLGR